MGRVLPQPTYLPSKLNRDFTTDIDKALWRIRPFDYGVNTRPRRVPSRTSLHVASLIRPLLGS